MYSAVMIATNLRCGRTSVLPAPIIVEKKKNRAECRSNCLLFHKIIGKWNWSTDGLHLWEFIRISALRNVISTVIVILISKLRNKLVVWGSPCPGAASALDANDFPMQMSTEIQVFFKEFYLQIYKALVKCIVCWKKSTYCKISSVSAIFGKK